ncbi:MAG: YbjN domain-containing protein [Oscillospiraceae bacterium]|nr:YbjN domain-containing protein [Oscillospiraceae bacterium]
MDTARTVYEKLCRAIESKGWTFEKEEEELLVHFRVSGDDLPMLFIIRIDEDRELVSLYSPLPVEVKEDKRVETALPVCMASSGMIDGHLTYDIGEGRIVFKMTATYHDSTVGEGLLDYMIGCSCAMVDKFNDLFFALNEGMIDIKDFYEKL